MPRVVATVPVGVRVDGLPWKGFEGCDHGFGLQVGLPLHLTDPDLPRMMLPPCSHDNPVATMDRRDVIEKPLQDLHTPHRAPNSTCDLVGAQGIADHPRVRPHRITYRDRGEVAAVFSPRGWINRELRQRQERV